MGRRDTSKKLKIHNPGKLLKRVGDLEIDQHLDYHRREWKLERAVRIFMGFIALYAIVERSGMIPVVPRRE